MNRFFLIILFLALTLPTCGQALAKETVLMISSYHPGFPTFFKQVDGVKSVLDPLGIGLDVEFMDSKRFFTTENIENFKKSLKYKLDKNPEYSAVITADDNALIFVLDNAWQLFPETPVVFCGVNNVALAMEQNNNKTVTGVIEHVSIKGTLDMITRILPKTSKIYVICDDFPSGAGDLATYRKMRKHFPGLQFTDLDLSKLTWTELGQRLNELEPDSALLLLSIYRDSTGKTKLFEQSLRFIEYNSNVPIFHCWEHGIGQGVVGGKVVSHYAQGQTAAKMVVEILNGAPVQELPVIKGDTANRYMFDHNQLAKFSIPEKRLPKDSIIINKDYNFIRSNLKKFLIILVLILVQATAIIYLAVNRRYLKKVEKKLAVELETFSNMFKQSSAAMLLVDPADGTIADANNAASNFYGYTIDQLKLIRIGQINILSSNNVLDEMQKATKGAQSTFSFRHKLANGEVRDVEVKSGPVHIGNKDMLFSIIIDVTEKNRIQKELTVSEKRYRSLIENAPNIIMILAEHRIEFINRNGALALGRIDPVTVVGTNIKDIITTDSYKELTGHIIQAESGQFSRPFKMSISFGDKPETHIQTVVGPVNGDGRISTVLIGVDITNLKNQQESLLEYSRVVEGANEMMTVIDRDFKYRMVNTAYLKARNLDKDEVIGQDVEKFIPRETFQSHCRNGLKKAFAGKKSSFITMEDTPSGEVYYSTRLYPVYNDQGEVFRVAAVLTDITNQKAYEEAIFKAKQAAEKSNLAKTEFLANMSHELRTPLNGIMGMIQLLDTTELDHEQQEYILAAHKSCRNLTRILSDLLILSDVEAGNTEVNEAEFNLFELLNTARENFTEAATQKGLKLTVTPDKSMPRILISDSVRIRHILFNLMANAVKFTETGEVNLNVSMLPGHENGQARLLFMVKDTGIGIPDDMVEDIFEPFTQVEKTYTRQYQGTGLGLRIVKRLIDIMGGTLSIESEPGTGTCVYFTIAAKMAKDPGIALATEAHRRQDKERGKILIAEDEDINRITLSTFLEKNGFDVTSVRDGSELYGKLEKEDFNCILMDIQMPKMNGMEATRLIRASKELGAKAHIPIIALTAYAMESDRSKFLNMGMNEYLPKPLDLNKLLMTIRRVAA